MIRPKTIVQVSNEVPNKDQQQAVQEFFVLEGQGENLTEFDLGAGGVRIFNSSGLHGNIDENQSKGDVTHD